MRAAHLILVCRLNFAAAWPLPDAPASPAARRVRRLGVCVKVHGKKSLGGVEKGRVDYCGHCASNGRGLLCIDEPITACGRVEVRLSAWGQNAA